MPRKQHLVRLSATDRQTLRAMIRHGRRAATTIQRAHILLKADASSAGPALTDKPVAAAVEVSPRTVAPTRAAWGTRGWEALERKRRATPPVPPKLGAAAATRLVAVACSTPPEGVAQWSLRRLAQRAIALERVETIAHETVRHTRDKNDLKPWRTGRLVIPPDREASFVAGMAAILEVYLAPPDPKRPLIGFDEAGKELQAHVRAPWLAGPGQEAREEYEDRRHGSANLVLRCAPHLGWRQVGVSARRPGSDRACARRELVDPFPAADTLVVVLDNLSTHRLSSL